MTLKANLQSMKIMSLHDSTLIRCMKKHYDLITKQESEHERILRKELLEYGFMLPRKQRNARRKLPKLTAGEFAEWAQ